MASWPHETGDAALGMHEGICRRDFLAHAIRDQGFPTFPWLHG